MTETSALVGHKLWWALMRRRIEQVGPGFATSSESSIQFEVLDGPAVEAQYFVCIGSSGLRAGEGPLPASPQLAIVRGQIQDFVRILEHAPGARLEVSGSFDRVYAFFERLKTAKQPSSWLDVRSGGVK
jgi:hypothetical protein